MSYHFEIINAAAIKLFIQERSGISPQAHPLSRDLAPLTNGKIVTHEFAQPQLFQGKKIKGIIFKTKEVGEVYFLENQYLHLEFEEEMAEEFCLFVTGALQEGGFQTPEIMRFSSQKPKGKELTIYGDLVQSSPVHAPSAFDWGTVTPEGVDRTDSMAILIHNFNLAETQSLRLAIAYSTGRVKWYSKQLPQGFRQKLVFDIRGQGLQDQLIERVQTDIAAELADHQFEIEFVKN